MALTTEARHEIADALNAEGITAFASVPPTITVPSVVVVPADPYALPDRIGPVLNYTGAWTLTVLAQALDNEAGLAAVEDLIDRTVAALPSGVYATRVSRPLLDDLGAQGSVYVAEVSVTAHLTGPLPLPPVDPIPPSVPGMPVIVDIKPDGPGMYTCALTWTAPDDEGSSPIIHYEVMINGNVNVTSGPETMYPGISIPAGAEYQTYVVAVNSEARSMPSDSNIIYAPPT